MILKITRQTINNNNIIKTFEPTIVECVQLELDIIIIPKLKQLVAVNNLHYDLIGSDNKCQYLINTLDIMNIEEFVARNNKSICDGISTYNKLVDGVNVDIKRSNKKNNRPIKTGLLNNISEDLVKIGAKGIRVEECETRLLVR